ncbi:MAG: hypothetical protein Q8R20_01040 [Nanoarchaeota archaeon]|nr:hypothetical protein [Nanoarchaeota archaeon]
MNIEHTNRSDGFVAVVSAIIVSALVLAIAVFVGVSGFFGYEDTQALERKSAAVASANGCLRHALLYLASGAYEGGETINIAGSACEVLPIMFGTSTITIKASSTVRGSVVNLRLVVDSYTLAKVRMEEF